MATKSTYARELDRACRYVGSFLHSFAGLEITVNWMFLKLYDLENLYYPELLLCQLDLRKKLKLLELGFAQQKRTDHKKLLSRIHHLHDVRNAIVHTHFETSPSATTVVHGKKVKVEAGIYFDYINASGNFPIDKQKLQQKLRKKKEEGDILLWGDVATITYSEFHQYGNEMAEIARTLESIEITPLGQPTAGLARNIAEIVASSDNIIPSRKKPSPKSP
jgi:hypothetical protein